MARNMSDSLPKLLKPVDKTNVFGMSKFTYKGNFKEGENGISLINANFSRYFRSKIELNIQDISLNIYEAIEWCDSSVFKFLQREKEEFFLAHLFNLLKNQPDDKTAGPLLTHCTSNLFLITGTNGVCRIVDVGFSGKAGFYEAGWFLHAHSMRNPCLYLPGSRVFLVN
ncbi:MAG: hypothetical protein HYX20_01430 [Candidatus Yanofskybacteria bacterium]|nr:hypothetical protein [Candidatus Yanofskybacteria bacterium]